MQTLDNNHLFEGKIKKKIINKLPILAISLSLVSSIALSPSSLCKETGKQCTIFQLRDLSSVRIGPWTLKSGSRLGSLGSKRFVPL